MLNFNKNNIKELDKISSEVIETFDACVILTNHTNIDYGLIAKKSKLIIDTRNVFKNVNNVNIVRLGQG